MPGPHRQHGVWSAWLTPMRAARGPLRGVGVGWSYFIHLLGGVLFFGGIWLFDLIFFNSELTQEIGWEFERQPYTMFIVIGAWIVAIELLFILLGWATICWGAGVEPFSKSFGRSLSRWYQLTPWLVFLGVATMLGFIGWDRLDNWYWDRYGYARYGSYYDDHGYDQPMQLITPDRFELLMTIARFGSLGIANLITLWWVLGTAAVHRHRPTWFASCRWPAACEGCGYALAGLTDEQCCPECGKPVGQSKHTDRGQRDTDGLRMMLRALIKPGMVGATMLTRRPTKMPVRVLLWGLFFTVLAGPVLMVMSDIGERIGYGYTNVEHFGDVIEHYLVYGLTTGIYAALIGGLLLLGAGTLVGTIIRVFGKRDIMPAACNAACYSAALLPIWVLLQGVQLLILIPLGEYLDERGMWELTEFFPLLIILMHAGVLTYLILHIARITKAARHANV